MCCIIIVWSKQLTVFTIHTHTHTGWGANDTILRGELAPQGMWDGLPPSNDLIFIFTEQTKATSFANDILLYNPHYDTLKRSCGGGWWIKMCPEMCSWIARPFGTCLPMKRVFFLLRFSTPEASLTGNGLSFCFSLPPHSNYDFRAGRIFNQRASRRRLRDGSSTSHTHTLAFILTSSTRSWKSALNHSGMVRHLFHLTHTHNH